MSFPNQSLWMARGSDVPGNSEMAYDQSSRIEPKRPHQWLMDGSETDLLPNKKHAMEVPTGNLFSGLLNPNVPPWGNGFGFHSIHGHFTDRFFDAETARTANFHDKNTSSISTEKIILGRNGNEEPYGDHSFCLSMSHALEDPQSTVNYGGIRKVKVSQVKDTDNLISSPLAQGYERVDNNSMSAANCYRIDENTMTMGLAFSKGEENVITITDNYDREDGVFISMGQSSNKGDDYASMASYKETNSSLAVDHAFNKVENSIISVSQTYHRDDESAVSKSSIYRKESSHSVCRDDIYNRENSSLSVGESCGKGQSTIISFGGSNHDDDSKTSGRIISNYEFLMPQSSSQISGTSNDKDLVESRTNTLGSDAVFSSIDVSAKKAETKVSKKVQNNCFPSNVRSLLSTGMLDGVSVKYIAWSREKELSGIIKGSGYQCGCEACDFSKVVNGYEFERHAGCKTKHPNNHIYFENGKTVYGIVQELRNTPQDMLFDVIQTITGSSINQKSFRLWKESYLAATRELQRIYGKDEGNLL